MFTLFRKRKDTEASGALRPLESPSQFQILILAKISFFTIAVNTGPLPDEVLLDAGANLLFHSMPEFNEQWETLKKFFYI